MDKLPIKGILFDFGGTLDTDGNHWGEVLWDVYQHFDLPVVKADFREAYKTGERTLATQLLIQPNFHFADVLRTKFGIQLDYLIAHRLLSLSSGEKEQLAATMTEYADGQTRAVLAESATLLRELKKEYKLVLVSNFYGNIRTVLEDASLLPLFEQIIESAVVGVRKPNPAIFALGVCALDLPASQVLVVGDSFPKDIQPAHRLGCHTIWLKGRQWEEEQQDETLPDAVVRHLSEIKAYL